MAIAVEADLAAFDEGTTLIIRASPKVNPYRRPAHAGDRTGDLCS